MAERGLGRASAACDELRRAAVTGGAVEGAASRTYNPPNWAELSAAASQNPETSMRLKTATHFIALAIVAFSLAGCLERGQPTMVDSSGDDDAFCRASNVAVGSPEYVACRKDRDVQRANANARTDRRQRNLGEYMLNNPSRP
jgi:hypothetical protein